MGWLTWNILYRKTFKAEVEAIDRHFCSIECQLEVLRDRLESIKLENPAVYEEVVLELEKTERYSGLRERLEELE